MSTGNFNSAATKPPSLWPEEGVRALATWWADQLPGAEAVTGRKPSPHVKPGKDNGITFNAEHYAAFVEELTRRIAKAEPFYKNGGEFVQVLADHIVFGAAAKATGLAISTDMISAIPRPSATMLFKDGQIFVPAEKGLMPLEYPGKPDVPFRKLKEIDFSGCSYFRDEARYLVVPVEEGQACKTVQWDNGPAYHDAVAEAGQALVVLEDTPGLLDKIDAQDALNPEKNRGVTFSYLAARCEYDEGVYQHGQTMGKTDARGVVRALSDVFRAWRSDDTFACGSGSLYKIVRPGDWVTRKEGTGECAIVEQAWRDDGHRVWKLCDAAGNLEFPMELDTAAKIGRPLQFKPRK